MIDLMGKKAIVTGGGSGIGSGICQILAQVGADVFVADLDYCLAEKIAGNLIGQGSFYSGEVDVTNQESVANVVDRSINLLGNIDILVNNAGIIGVGSWWEREKPNDEDWERVHDVNVRGMVRMSNEVSPHMIGRNYGKIVNIASISGRQGSPDLPHYSSSKAAAISWTQSNALQLASFGINVNAVCPGLLWTPMWEAIARKRALFGGPAHGVEGLTGREVFDTTIDQWIPMKREQTPEDIGNLVSFLVSDLAKNITGQSINVDGGRFTS